ncbi:hypothetical protein L798_03043 [Zootermopsis nevadensis]|uniref:Uncharacterized protein n=2 Tax=Zootermopsis nevadensis TaxID=136037 RepID=A0A067RN30_ZOONE|nr:hypothetical protein L798_03043 [Zootermopsis nevadensis]
MRHPVYSKFQAHMQIAERNKRLQNAASSNKVETYAVAPPSILGSFSVFGHATVKTRDRKKSVPEHLVPPPMQQAESEQHFRYEHPTYYFQEQTKTKPFLPSQQIEEFPAAYSSIGHVENFEPFYKTFSHTTTTFGDSDVKFLPQSVGMQVSGSASFQKPGQVQDVPLHPSRLNGATGPHLSDHSYILSGSTPFTSFEDQVYVTTWPSAPPQQREQYVPKPSLRPAEKSRVTRPYFQEINKNRAESEEGSFTPTSQTYIRKPVFLEETTIPSHHINEVRRRKPVLPTPLTEEENIDQPKEPYPFPDFQSNVRSQQSQGIRLPATSVPEEGEILKEQDVQDQRTRRPVNRIPATSLDIMRVRRPSYSQKQPAGERTRRPVSRNKPSQEEQKHRKRRPILEELTTQPSIADAEDTPTAPLLLDSSEFQLRKKMPASDRGRGKERTRARPPKPLTTEKPVTESPWSSDGYVYDPELQSTSHELYEPNTFNEVTDEDFISTKSGSQTTVTSTTTTTPTTTTTSTTKPPSTTTARSRLRFPTNTTRPRFSLRGHKERLERLSAMTKNLESETKPEESETSRGRNRSRGSSTQEDEEPDRGRVRQRESQQGRLRSSTTTSTETSVTTVPSTSAERVNHFKPISSRYRPGASKHYSGYRTRTTESAGDAHTSASSTTPRTVAKSAFSVTRKPFPLRTRPPRVTTSSSTTTSTEQVQPAEDSAVSDSKPVSIVTEVSKDIANDEATEDKILPVMSEKVDTTTTADEAEPLATNPPSSEQDTISPSQIVADLTSAANSGGYFSKHSNSNLRITMATEDPILPIEAFFPVRSSRDVLS